MARRCKISGKQGQFGHRVSHAKNRTKHLFKPNLQNRRLFVSDPESPNGGRYVTVKVSTRVMRTIDKLGVQGTLRKYGITLGDLLA
ncbi:MAG: 50S ribosomal protein L28 [Bdellovibrionales bacterium]|nr:50S ribosomal protein L28 [Bdellovibrionales bacterium]